MQKREGRERGAALKNSHTHARTNGTHTVVCGTRVVVVRRKKRTNF